jgi:ubiquinone/menaquinone biosynthesis C-methylase UbiE
LKLLHLGCDDDIRAGFDNLDRKINGWTFESGLPYADSSVNGITISHALMYVTKDDWPGICKEFYRALCVDGVVRITEDDTESTHSGRYKVLYPGAAIATGPVMARMFLESAGLTVKDCAHNQTFFSTNALLIAHREHKVPKYVFYAEGIKRAIQIR